MRGVAGKGRRRLDEELVAQGYFATTDEALRAVLAGEVSSQGRRLTSAGERVVDHTAKFLFIQRVEIREILLPNVTEKRGDLRIIDKTDEWHALASGEDQRVQAHGDDGLHP